MPMPAVALPPLAWKLGGYVAVAALSWTAARRVPASGPWHARREQALDELPEGVELTRAHAPGAARIDGRAKLRRALRLGRNGPGLAAEFSGIARLRLRRLR